MKKSVKAMQKLTVNFAVNAIMTFCMTSIIGTGFLIKYKLISGQERWEIYGENVELYFLGMTRYQWGMLHLILGCILLGLLIVHISLHWKIIIHVLKKIIKEPVTKKLVAFLFIILCALMIVMPFFIQLEIESINKGKGCQVTLVTNLQYQYS